MSQTNAVAELTAKILKELIVKTNKVFNFEDAASASRVFKGYETPERKIFMSNYYFQSGLGFQQTFGANILREEAGSARTDFIQFRGEISALIKERVDAEFAPGKQPLSQEANDAQTADKAEDMTTDDQ